MVVVVGTVVVGVVVVVEVVLGTDVIIVMGTLVVVMILPPSPLLTTFTGFLSLMFCLLLLMTNLDNGTRCVLGLTNL